MLISFIFYILYIRYLGESFARIRSMNKSILTLLCSVVLITGCSGTKPKLGVINGQLKSCPDTPNCVSTLANNKEQRVQAIHFRGEVKEAQQRLLTIVKKLDRAIIKDVREDYILIEFTSTFFRFIDDVEFYFPVTTGDKTMIHFRSASRLGHSDLGVNRKRFEQISAEFRVD